MKFLKNLGILTYAYSPTIWKLRQGNFQMIEASLGTE